MKHNILEQLGLNDNESVVYNLLLSEGAKTPPEIAAATGITRANSYFVLQSLISMGLVERKEKKKKYQYSPLSPDKLTQLVENEKREVAEKEKILAAVLPELSSMFNMHTNKPSVSYFEGKEGIKTFYNDIWLQKPSEAILFRSPLDEEYIGLDSIRADNVRLTKAGIFMRIISPSGPIMTEVDGLKLNREVRYIDKNKYPFESELCVYNNHIAIVAFGKNKVGMLIDNKELANTLRSIFEIVWVGLK
jgi:sugar-specific transcriptional regulator TrmB